MTESHPAPAPPRWLSFMPAITVASIIIGALIAVGGVVGQVRTNTERIDKLERKVELIEDINVRTARIETKMDALMPAKEPVP